MNCTKFCGFRISIRRALLLAAIQIGLALIIATSSEPDQAGDAATSDRDGQIVSRALTN